MMMQGSRWVLMSMLVCCLALIGAGCSDNENDALFTDVNATPKLTTNECMGTLGDEALRCGVLTVPENWDAPSKTRIELPFIVLPALGDPALIQDDPIVYLEGGPGASGLESFAFFASLTELRQGRDMIFLEYRGVGVSNPSFPCRVVDDVTEATITDCWNQAIAAGMNPAHYNTRNAALDFQALRQEMGIEQWNIWGISYGTTSSQILSEIDPEGTRSVTLDSPTSPSVEIARADLESWFDGLSTLIRACEIDDACNTAFPDLKTKMERNFVELTENPWEHGSPVLTEFFGPTIDGDTFLFMINDFDVAARPALIHLIAERDLDGLVALDGEEPDLPGDDPGPAPPEPEGFPDFGELGNRSFWASVYCAEEAPHVTLGTVPPETIDEWIPEITATPFFRQNWDFCEYWPVPAAPDEDVDLVRNDIPTLILTGQLDNLTPKRQGEIVAAGLENAVLIDVPVAEHTVVPGAPCATAIMAEFLRDPFATPNQECLDQIPPITFFGLGAGE